MRKFLLVLMVCSFASCYFFESTDEKTQKLVNEKLQRIDWTDVDKYPLFDGCDETVSKIEQKKCFIETLSFCFTSTLQEFQPVLNKILNDTVFVDFIVVNTGDISIINIHNKEVFEEQMQEFEEKIIKNLTNLPRIEPALKRGIPVSTKFRIPIVIN